MRLSGQAQVVPTCIAILDCRGLSYIYIYISFFGLFEVFASFNAHRHSCSEIVLRGFAVEG